MKVKICGITNLEDALMCENLGAHALGFILYEKSKRYVTPKSAKKIIDSLSPFTLKVGVFVNEESDVINRISKDIKLNAVQLHGDESPEIADKIEFPVIKSFRINDEFDFSKINNFPNASILLDAFSQNGFGGTGKKFNWNLIPQNIKNKIILSGGISSENIKEAYEKINPAAIDLSSSLEKMPGKKDKIKVTEFFKIFNNLSE